MKKVYSILLLLISFLGFSQTGNFPYQLDYWKPLGIEIKHAFPMPNDEYMLIARVTNYSPETYPGLFTDAATQQDWQNKTGFISIRTTTDFTPIVIHSLFFTVGNDTLQTNHQFFKGTDNNIYFYLYNEIGKVNTTGELAYKQTLDVYYINSLTYYNGFLYGLENHMRDVPVSGEIVYGKLLKIDATTGVITNSKVIADTTAIVIEYLGIAVDATGVYVFGTASYNKFVTGYEPNTTFFIQQGLFNLFKE